MLGGTKILLSGVVILEYSFILHYKRSIDHYPFKRLSARLSLFAELLMFQGTVYFIVTHVWTGLHIGRMDIVTRGDQNFQVILNTCQTKDSKGNLRYHVIEAAYEIFS